jgi:hypothetical protein
MFSLVIGFLVILLLDSGTKIEKDRTKSETKSEVYFFSCW